MRKQGGTPLRKTAAILLSGILSLGIVFGGVTPVTVLAQENFGTESMTHDDTVSGNTVEIPAKPPVEQGDEPAKKDVPAENMVSGNEIMTVAETAEDNGREAGSSGTDWELSANGTLTIDSDAGMTDWKDNGWSSYKEEVKRVVIMAGVTRIAKGAFQGCTNMVSVDMPNSVTEIDWYAFDGCSSLKAVSIPNGVKRLEIFIFRGCENLVSVRLPESLEYMANTFEECSQLQEIVIPPNVEYIASNTFKNCVRLEEVIMCSESVTLVEGGTFSGCKFYMDRTKGIIVPPGKGQKYKEKYTADDMHTQVFWYVDNIREHTHTWDTAWTSNPFHHWHECTSECTTWYIADKEGYALHTEDAGTITKQPTRTEAGIRTYHCSVCGYKMREEAIPATGTADDNIPDVSGNDEENNGRPQNPSDPEDNGGGSNRPASAEEAAVNDVSSNNVYDNIISDKNSTTVGPGVAAKDDEPKTGDSTHIELYATLAMVMGFTWLLLYFADNRRGMTEEEKRELVSKLICWAKQGGKFRRICAVAAIFVLLFYYHSIGKRIAVEWKQAYGE